MLADIRKIFSRIPHHIKYILSLFVVTRIILVFIGAMTNVFIGHDHEPTRTLSAFLHVPYLHMWNVWDSLWYVNIASQGYTFPHPFNPMEFSTLGFFPLYSIL